ncbi:MAG: hypothetical protein H6741_06415 [Alphaproteobacteria bacterium]|nr:hypothetical protein [Alphaproteobacteria bacterium]MCB9792344.1 hypothetical protein [Alphaproteobacteria bacterium]
MSPETFKLALRSTARVACAAALVGCVPKTVTPDDSSGGADDTQVSADDSAATDDSALADDSAATDDSAAADDSAATDDSGATGDSGALAECWSEVDAVYGESGSGTPDEGTAECCQEIAEYWDSVNLAGMEGWATRNECCELLQWQGSLACTPWGPPCPPAMGEELV